MTALHPHLLWLLALVPVVWWLAQRRATRGTAVIPHLPVLESILTARDTSPSTPPWRAVALAAGCAFAVFAAADIRAMEPAPRRVLLLWWGDASVGEWAREWRSAKNLPEDDVHLLQAGPAGLRTDSVAREAQTDARRPAIQAALEEVERLRSQGTAVVTRAGSAPRPHEARCFRLTSGPDGLTAHAAWRGTRADEATPMVGRLGRDGWETVWIGDPIPRGAPLEFDALLPSEAGRVTLVAALAYGRGLKPRPETFVSASCIVPAPRPVLLVTDGAQRGVERPLIAALASMPDLISSAGRVELANLARALEEQPGALCVGLGVGPSAAPEADWLCIEPPEGDALLPLEASEHGSIGVAERFSGAHPISRGLTSAGIELDRLLTVAGTGPAAKRDARYEPLLITDAGVAAVAGSPAGDARLVALLGDGSRAFAGFPSWPRFIRRSVAWISDGRIAHALSGARAGSADAEQPADSNWTELLPGWRGRTRGAVRWGHGVKRVYGEEDLVLEPDPFRPARPERVDLDETQLPPRRHRPAPGDPASWPALLAALLLAAAVFRLPGAAASRS